MSDTPEDARTRGYAVAEENNYYHVRDCRLIAEGYEACYLREVVKLERDLAAARERSKNLQVALDTAGVAAKQLISESDGKLAAAREQLVVARAAMEPALRYIEHIGANHVMRGEPHPQQKIVDDLRAALTQREEKS